MENRRSVWVPECSYEDASVRAEAIVREMTLDEKIEMIGGHNSYFVNGVEKRHLPRLYLADATSGVHIRKDVNRKMERSTAFPAPILLASTWNTELAYEYGRCVGEECRAGEVAVLLGPGVNICRNAQNGRNFEYFGEDPCLAARAVEQYVLGVQSTGTMATLKHFVCNNTDHHRRTSNSVVDERTLHEIYLPAFKAGIDAGAMAVMTAYNQVNGEWCGQSAYVIGDILRKQLGFTGLVMSDWWSVWDPVKAIASGLDLDMPGHGRRGTDSFDDFGNPFLRSNAKQLVYDGKAAEADIHRMTRNIISAMLMMGLDKRPILDASMLERFPYHQEIALKTAREGIVLLRNRDNILPIKNRLTGSLLLTGMFTDKIACGGGAANVEGYDVVSLRKALGDEFGDSLRCIESPTDDDFRSAGVALVSIGTFDSEGWDSAFELPGRVNDLVLRAASLNKNVVVIMNSGRGVGMTGWIDKIAGLLYCWYPGQVGNVAVAEILAGKTNPSGKLPITIERRFEDSPAFPYIPRGEALYEGWDDDFRIDLPINTIEYKEGIFVGYRWYEKKRITPLFPFGRGMSYTTFSYANIHSSSAAIRSGENVRVSWQVTNSGKIAGHEICQVYVRDVESTAPRPEKELKGFKKIFLVPGETEEVSCELTSTDFSFYDTAIRSWVVEPGKFIVMVGSSSVDLPLCREVSVV